MHLRINRNCILACWNLEPWDFGGLSSYNALFIWLIGHDWKYCSLIYYERKTLLNSWLIWLISSNEQGKALGCGAHLEHLQQYYVKPTTYFSIWVATYFYTTYILLSTPVVLPKTGTQTSPSREWHLGPTCHPLQCSSYWSRGGWSKVHRGMACRGPGNIGASRGRAREARAASREARHRATGVREGAAGRDLGSAEAEAARRAKDRLARDERGSWSSRLCRGRGAPCRLAGERRGAESISMRRAGSRGREGTQGPLATPG
jgi:hypothetical protein